MAFQLVRREGFFRAAERRHDVAPLRVSETPTSWRLANQHRAPTKASHGGGAHGKHDHGALFESEELAPGATFSYEVDEHQAGKTVPYHSHLRPALNGKIMVSDGHGHGHKQVDAITIEYSDEAASPNEVHVSPGTIITWINNSSIPQTVVSGLHADFVEDEHKDTGMAMDTGGHSDKDAHDDEEKEIEIGIVEVQPR